MQGTHRTFISWHKSKRINDFMMHLAFQTALRTSDFHFFLDVYSSLCAALQDICFFAEHIMSILHKMSAMFET